MIISQACKYGIRALIYLAGHAGSPVLSRTIAADLEIPEHFLAKVLQDLSREGFLSSFKGRSGGFRLARPADQIRLLDVVRAVEGPRFGQDCVLGLPECSDASPCPLHLQWGGIRDQIMEMLRNTSVQHALDETSPAAAPQRPAEEICTFH